jgi:hypothetical protein
LLTPGNTSDVKAAKPLLEPLKAPKPLPGDKEKGQRGLRKFGQCGKW